jgi:hypothetical protein
MVRHLGMMFILNEVKNLLFRGMSLEMQIFWLAVG